MSYRNILFTALAALLLLSACADDEVFTSSPARILTFSTDTVTLDTVFSNVPSPRRDMWVYNRSGEGIRCTNIRLERGNQSGFRVNVDGTYLGASSGYQTSNVERRNKDSLRVFVEVTTPYNHAGKPSLVDDNLLFTLESGVVQKVNLNVYSLDARLLRDVKISRDSVLSSGSTPIIIYGGITVEEGATLTISAGTTLYFHADAGIDVFGRLNILGEADKNVVLRGDRIDRMFDYLPYDGVSGQWKGIRFHESSYDNWLQFADIHSTFDGIVA
ncbi:MAG: right-handed parallel beta-helix repeat-containing protein, partial [Prevotella sp.]|nr:right-handed parallel beta-helix repeat-containing protein [Prevotella sp.]